MKLLVLQQAERQTLRDMGVFHPHPRVRIREALSGHCMDGLQTWCNNNLGVVYLATAPGLPQVVDDCPF